MDSDKLDAHFQYVERNGACLNVEERTHLSIAFREIKVDLKLSRVFFVGKVSGKSSFVTSRHRQGLLPLHG